jgi:acyl-CoA synthetase (AMP-forming)/AMP-acid ligase II
VSHVDFDLAVETAHLARQKCPRSIGFEAELPRLSIGKLYKRLLRDGYWKADTGSFARVNPRSCRSLWE